MTYILDLLLLSALWMDNPSLVVTHDTMIYTYPWVKLDFLRYSPP